MRLAFLVLAVLTIAAVIGLFLPYRVETYKDSAVIAGEIRRPIGALSPHHSIARYLNVDGRTYEGLRGTKPYYIKIPELRAILFVTESPNGRVVFHVFQLEKESDVAIDADTSGFGWNIGANREPGAKGSDYVESVRADQLTLATRSLRWKETLVLNLAKRQIEQREYFYFDRDGNITNHSILRPRN